MNKNEITKTLITEVRSGNIDSFGELVDMYEADVAKVIGALLKGRDEMDDLIQETFVRAFEKLDSFDDDRQFDIWIKAIARNLVWNSFKKEKCRSYHMNLYRENLLARHDLELTEQWEDQRLAQLENCMKRLSEQARSALSLRYHDGLSVKEVGERLKRSFRAAEKLLSRSRLSLRDCIKSTGIVR